MSDSRDTLFQQYDKRIDLLDLNIDSKLAWFKQYIDRHYMQYIKSFSPDSTHILDIGCSRGYSLHALYDHGFTHLTGIDLSHNDIEAAKTILPQADFLTSDAFEYLEAHPATYDVILIKAVLEHIPKDKVLPLLSLIKRSLKPEGIVIIDVPNMDWIFSSHERYMDFTHEVGFTRESMAQVLGSVFPEYHVTPLDNAVYSRRLTKYQAKIGRTILKLLFTWAEPESEHYPIWMRSLLGIGKNV